MGRSALHGRSGSPYNTGFLWSKSETASWSFQPFLHSSAQSVHRPILHNRPPLCPSKLPLTMGQSGPPYNTWFLGPRESSIQTARWLVEPFLQVSLLTWQTDGHLDHATRSITIGHLRTYTVSQKKGATLSMAITLSILHRFAKFFHCCKEQSISNKIHIKLPTTP